MYAIVSTPCVGRKRASTSVNDMDDSDAEASSPLCPAIRPERPRSCQIWGGCPPIESLSRLHWALLATLSFCSKLQAVQTGRRHKERGAVCTSSTGTGTCYCTKSYLYARLYLNSIAISRVGTDLREPMGECRIGMCMMRAVVQWC